MPKGQIKIAFVEDCNKRKACFNKRSNSLVKSTNALNILCGVDCCAIVISPFDGKEVVWPSVPDEMQAVLSKFTNLPEHKKDQNRYTQACFTTHRRKENRAFLRQCLADRENVDNFSTDDILNVTNIIEAKLIDIKKRREFLVEHPQPEPTQGNFKEVVNVIVIPDTSPVQNKTKSAEPSDSGKGKKVMNVVRPFDLNRVKTEKEDPDIAGTWWEDPSKFSHLVIKNKSDRAGPSSHD